MWVTFAHKFGRLTIPETCDVLVLSEISAMDEKDFFLPYYYHYGRLKRPNLDPLDRYIRMSLIFNFKIRDSSLFEHFK